MGIQVDTPDQWKASDLFGGYIRQNKRVYRGVLRDREGRLVWICDHAHSRPEYNARWQHDPDLVWEYSALNCGREAYFQWRLSRVSGLFGLVEEDLSSGKYPRDDMKEAYIGSVRYLGRVWLSEDGHRMLSIRRPDRDDHDHQGSFYLDSPKNTVRWPVLSKRALERWLVAAYWLNQETWGVTFRNPTRPVQTTFDPALAERYKPKRTNFLPKTKPDEPFIKTIRESGKRQYAVCYGDGTIATTLPHRGQAAKELHRLKESSK